MSLQSYKDIIENIYSNPNYLDRYNKINPILFDTTLRDGIQNANPEHFSTESKQTIFHNILHNYKCRMSTLMLKNTLHTWIHAHGHTQIVYGEKAPGESARSSLTSSTCKPTRCGPDPTKKNKK